MALLGAVGCSGPREEIVATLRLEAGAPDVEEKCEPRTTEATDMGLDLYFVLEHSSWTTSSTVPGPGQTSDWGLLTLALGSTFSSSASEFSGIGAGFGVFPMHIPPQQSCVDSCSLATNCWSCVGRCGCQVPREDPQGVCGCDAWDVSCDDADYGPRHEITRVSESGDVFWSDLFSASNDFVFNDDPVLYPALIAGSRYRAIWDEQHHGRPIVQVLIVKSLRYDCSGNDHVPDLERVLSSDTAKTYVVAVNPMSDDQDFDRLAAAGRTMTALRIRRQSTPNPTAALQDLIRKIRATDGRCEYLLSPPPGEQLDPRRVNLAASSGGLRFHKVPNRAACANDSLGWFYDTDETPSSDPPKRIIACDGACRMLHGGQDASTTGGSARIELGCRTLHTADAGR